MKRILKKIVVTVISALMILCHFSFSEGFIYAADDNTSSINEIELQKRQWNSNNYSGFDYNSDYFVYSESGSNNIYKIYSKDSAGQVNEIAKTTNFRPGLIINDGILFYDDGKKIYKSELDGTGKSLFFEPEIMDTYSYLSIHPLSNSKIIVSIEMGDAAGGTEAVYIVDLVTGKHIQLEMSAQFISHFFTSDNYLYYEEADYDFEKYSYCNQKIVKYDFNTNKKEILDIDFEGRTLHSILGDNLYSIKYPNDDLLNTNWIKSINVPIYKLDLNTFEETCIGTYWTDEPVHDILIYDDQIFLTTGTGAGNGFAVLEQNGELNYDNENILIYKGLLGEEIGFYENKIIGSCWDSSEGKQYGYQTIYDLEKIIHADFKSGNKKYSGKNGFYYKDSYFENDSSDYNHSLATMSLCLALSTYQNTDKNIKDENVKTVLKDCGFDLYKSYEYDKKPTESSIGCAIGSKKLSDGSTLIAVAVRSGGYEAEWASNMNMGASFNHNGFDESSDKIIAYIESYIQSYNIINEIKLWITGFSRGAAVATQAAAKLNDSDGLSYTKNNIYNTANWDKNNIFVYGFATPAGVDVKNNPHSEKYNNIFNIIDYNDPVPLVAPDSWNLDRYGITKIFPYQECTNSKVFNKYISEIKSEMKQNYKIDEFKNYIFNIFAGENVSNAVIENVLNHDTLGTYNRKLVNALTNAIGTRKNYCLKYESNIEDFVKKWQGNNELDISIIFRELSDLVPKMILLHPHITTTLIKNISLIADVHINQDYYLSWMQLMDSNYNNSFPLIWASTNYRVIKVNCPVDIDVYDSENVLVASIKDETPQEIEGSSIIASIDENDQKIVYLPADEDYHIDIIAREDCQTTYTINECTGLNSDISKIVSYCLVEMDAGDKLFATLSAYSDEELNNSELSGSTVEYSLTHNDTALTPTIDIYGDDVEKYIYSVTTNFDEDKGTVHGGGVFIYGDFCKVTVTPNENEEFYGWYINGKKVSEDTEYRFEVNENVEIKAAFEKQFERNIIIPAVCVSVLIICLIFVIIMAYRKIINHK